MKVKQVLLISTLCLVIGILASILLIKSCNDKKNESNQKVINNPEGKQENGKIDDNSNPGENKLPGKNDESTNVGRKDVPNETTENVPFDISDMKAVFKNFLEAWNRMDLAAQKLLMASDFMYQDNEESRDREEYIAKKKTLYQKYDWISVESSNEVYNIDGNTGTVKYFQHFKSATYESWGMNTFYFRKTANGILIYREVFEPTLRKR